MKFYSAGAKKKKGTGDKFIRFSILGGASRVFSCILPPWPMSIITLPKTGPVSIKSKFNEPVKGGI